MSGSNSRRGSVLVGGGRLRRLVAAVSALTLAGSVAAMLAPVAAANAADPTYGGYVVDGNVPDAGTNLYPDASGSASELGPENGNAQQLAVIHTSAPPMLELTNPNAQVDLRNIWLDTNTAGDGIWLYGAWERDSSTGSGVIMFEFQQAAKPASCAYGTATEQQLIAGCNPWANRQAGDFVIVWDQQGGTTAVIKRTFVAGGGGVLALDGGVTLNSTQARAAYGDNGSRGEMAINLSATVFNGATDSCLTIANVIPGTVTGNSDTADYKDTVLADTSATYISNCGSVQVTKKTEPAGLTGSFPVTLDRAGGAAITFAGATSAQQTLSGHDDVETFADVLPAADYRLGETVPAGWQLESIVCAGADVTAAGTFTVVAGSVTSCVVANTKALPALTLDKAAAPAGYDAPGRTITYTYTLTNSGNVPLTGPFAVVDDKVAVTCLQPGSLAVGASTTCTATHVTTQADVDAGSITNVARGSATFSDTPVLSNEDTETVTADQDRSLLLAKSASPPTYSAVGQTISYSYLVTNTGNVTLAGPVTVSDDKVGVTCPAGGLAPAASTTCTATHSVTQADLDAGSITNVAQARADGVSSNSDDETVTAVQDRALTLDKSASPATYDTVGQTIAYSYVVTNAGNVTLAGPVSVTDDKATVTCPAGGLAPGGSTTCTAGHVITQGDLDAGSVTNVATASADGVTSNEDTETVQARQEPALSIDKSASPVTYDAVGQTIGYTYVVTNSGNVTLTGPVTVDDDRATATCPTTPSLAPGGTVSCTASHTVSQGDLDAGTVTNVATAGASFDGFPVTSPPDTATVTAVQNRALGIVKSASPGTYSAVGQVVGYSYLVTNTGNVTLSGPFTVTDDKTSTTCPATVSLAPEASITCTATYGVTQADLDAGAVTNVASASGGGATSPTDTETVTAVQTPVLSIDKSAGPATYSDVGQVIDYTYVVGNAGNVTVSGPVSVVDDKTTVSCPATASLAPGAAVLCTAAYQVTQADLDAGSVTNTARAYAVYGGAGISSEPDSATVDAVQSTGLQLVKTATPATYSAVGQVVGYAYEVTNTGNVTLPGPFTVADDKTPTTSCPATASLAPAASVVCTATYSVTQADLDAGSVTNVATATNGTVTSNEDSETVTAIQSPALALDKSAAPQTYASVGQLVSYSYEVTNTGNVTLPGPFTVSDDKAPATSCPSTPSLAPGTSITCTATYSVTQADLDAGSVTNVATATNGTVTSPPDDETVTAVQTPVLTIAKTAAPATYDAVDEVVSYSYVVGNAGNVTLSGPFSVVDDKAAVSCPDTAALSPGSTITCTATYTVTQQDLDAGSVTNVARAYAYTGDDPVSSEPDDETVTAEQRPALAVAKSASPQTYDAVGQQIGYAYEVTNTGNVTLSGPFTVADDKTTATCPATASLAPGASITCTASYLVTQADLDAGSVTNVATAGAVFGGEPVTAQPDEETVTAVQTPVLSIAKSAAPQTYDAVGQEIGYAYEVTNTGNVTLSGPFTVADDKTTATCPEPGSLAPGASITCTASYVVTQADLDAGSVTNVARAFATFGEEPVSSEPDSETVEAVQSPALSLIKQATVEEYVAVGDVITYTYVVTNSGNVTLPGPFAVDDDKTTVTCPATTSLAPGASLTCTAAYPVTQADVAAGSVTNVATATNGTVTSPPATETVTGTAVLPTAAPSPSPAPSVLPFVPDRPRVLPFTGSVLLPLVALGSAASLIGALLVGLGRRRPEEA